MNILKMLNEIKIDPTRKAGFDTQRGDFLIIYEKELETIKQCITFLIKSCEACFFTVNEQEITFPDILKLASAMLIVKRKNVDCLLITLTQTVREYNVMKGEKENRLTKKEYNFLKRAVL